jgi:hypothetical protein
MLVPTDFSLPVEVVNDLVDAGHQLLHSHPEYRRLLQQTGASPPAGHDPGPAGEQARAD